MLLLSIMVYSKDREDYLRAAERVVMPFSSHFGDERAREAALDGFRGTKRKGSK